MQENKNISMKFYLAIDLGTTGCRSILFDDNSTMVESAYEEYNLIIPKDNYVEQDAENWWEMTLRTISKTINKSGVNAKLIDSISISSQGITVVPVDENCTPLCHALTWLDSRADKEAYQIVKDYGEEKIFDLTGKKVSSAYTLPKLLWLKNNTPDIFNAAWKFLMPMEFLICKFTGKCLTDYSMASGTLMYDLRNFCWSNEILDFYRISKEKLPVIVEAGSKAGFVLPDIAQQLGLKKDCVVSVGAQDQKCAALGAGISEGVMTISLGTAAAITKLFKIEETSNNNSIGFCGYINRKCLVSEGVINTAGTCLRWIRDMLFQNENYDIIDMEAEAARKRGSNLLFYPYFAGASSPEYYPDSQGVFYGINLSTVRGDFALAVMEGVAFQIRAILESMNAYDNTHTVVLFGGAAKSKLWCSIISDITGMKISVPKSSEAAAFGAAMLAAKAVGKNLAYMETGEVYLPENTNEYNIKYSKYETMKKKMWK